jgi:ArsR family transcriptional regulator
MIVAVLSAMAGPTRLDAMRCLADGSEHCVCELMRKLGVTQSRMSRHMQVPKQAGLVVDRRDAQSVRHRINSGLAPPLIRLVEAALERPIVVREAAA